MEAFPGDFIYSASAFWGIPWLEAALGCPVRVSHATGSLYAVTPPGADGESDAEQRGIPGFDPRNPWMVKLVEFLQAAARRSAGRYPLGTTRMRGVADLLSALYGGENLVYRMLDQPEEIREASGRLADFYIKAGRLQLEHIPPFSGGIGSFYYHAWAPEGTVWHQEDSCMLLSPELYDDFIKDSDRKIFSAFRGNIMHFHSTGGYLPLDEVLALRPTAVELHIDSGGPSAEALFETHKKILADVPLIIWGALSREDFDWIFDKLPDRGVAVNAVVQDSGEAEELWNRYVANRGSK
jgi:hypothetical protein